MAIDSVMFELVWARLAKAIGEASKARAEAGQNPELLEDDARVKALARWLFLFDPEIGAVQAVHEAVEAGSDLTPEDLDLAQRTGEKLLDAVQPVLVGS